MSSVSDLFGALAQLSTQYADMSAFSTVVEFCKTRWEIPSAFVACYLIMVFATRKLIPQHAYGRMVDSLFIWWNLGLSVFSWWGVWHMSRPIFKALTTEGLYFTVCAEPKAIATGYGTNNPIMLALILFCFSKVPELGDTVFLILKRKPVRLLQWYHHSTVLLFCWLALATEYSPGLWFALTNYFVHSIMYLYFALMGFKSTAKLVKPIAPAITIIQITQMVWGLIVNSIAVVSYFRTGACQIQAVTVYAAVALYGSYFWLFTKLYLDSRRTAGKKGVMRAVSRKVSQALLNDYEDDDGKAETTKKTK